MGKNQSWGGLIANSVTVQNVREHEINLARNIGTLLVLMWESLMKNEPARIKLYTVLMESARINPKNPQEGYLLRPTLYTYNPWIQQTLGT